MLHTAMQAAIESARTFAQMDELGRQLWQGHGAGALSDVEAQALAERLHGRRAGIREAARPIGVIAGRMSLFPPRRHCVSPDRIASRDRRRLLASSGPMPPALAARFTEGQRAVLKIVADEVAAEKECGLCIDAIAARAGVSPRLVQNAIRLAEGDGLLTIEERRHQGRKNSPNLIRIISREWQAWIARGSKRKQQGVVSACPDVEAPARSMEDAKVPPAAIGCKALRPTDREDNSGDKIARQTAPKAAGTAEPSQTLRQEHHTTRTEGAERHYG